jgi:hypothetical protein
VISPRQRPLPDKTQNSQEPHIYARGWIRTHNPGKRAAADPRLTARGHWDRLLFSLCPNIFLNTLFIDNLKKELLYPSVVKTFF